MPVCSPSSLRPPGINCSLFAVQMIEEAGFRGVDYENLTFGVVAIHSGFKLA